MASAVQITFEDQKSINRFSRLNMDIHDTEREVKNQEEKLHSYEDALDEVDLACEDRTTLMVGESFVSLTTTDAMERLQQKKTICDAALEKARAEQEAMVKEMDDLKIHLYAKFGNLINLDE